MRKDHRPFWLKRLHRTVMRWRSRHFLEPQFDAVGPYMDAVYPQYVTVHGPNISIGRCATLRSARAYPITLTTWTSADREGRIDIGDHVLISPGTRILSSDHVRIGSNTMIAGEVYISDSDWHDVYDRTSEQDAHSPITLEEPTNTAAHVRRHIDHIFHRQINIGIQHGGDGFKGKLLPFFQLVF